MKANGLLPDTKVSEREARKFPSIYVLVLLASLGGFLFGYNTAIMSGSMLPIQDYFHLSIIWQELIVSGTIAAAAVFAFLAGRSCDIFGRKRTIMAASMILTVGAVVMGVAYQKEMLLIGRIVVGIGIGLESMAVPVYVAEVAPTHTRGRLVSFFQLFITIGMMLSSLTAGMFSSLRYTGWRYMLGLGGIPSLIQLVGFISLPESPRWLVMKDRSNQAKEVIQRLRPRQDVDIEMEDIGLSVMESSKATDSVLKRVVSTPPVLKALFIGCGLQAFQQLCGINAVVYYSGSILRMAGFPSNSAIWMTLVPNAINVAVSIVALYTIDRVGRRKLLIISLSGLVLALAILSIGFLLSSINNQTIDHIMMENNTDSNTLNHCSDLRIRTCEVCILQEHCGFCYQTDVQKGSCLEADRSNHDRGSLYGPCNSTAAALGVVEGIQWTFDYCHNDYAWMAIVGLVVFLVAFAPGMGPVPWAMNSEIYPLWARGTCTAIATGCNWVTNLIVSLTFLTLTQTITTYGAFGLFAGISVLGLIFAIMCIPETKNKSLEELTKLFERQTQSQINEVNDKSDTDLRPLKEL